MGAQRKLIKFPPYFIQSLVRKLFAMSKPTCFSVENDMQKVTLDGAEYIFGLSLSAVLYCTYFRKGTLFWLFQKNLSAILYLAYQMKDQKNPGNSKKLSFCTFCIFAIFSISVWLWWPKSNFARRLPVRYSQPRKYLQIFVFWHFRN